MRRMTLAILGLAAIGVSACGGAEQGDGPLGDAQQAQVDPGLRDYVIYSITDGSGSQVGQILVTATAGDGYAANTEYWYMTSNLSNTASYTFTGGTSEYWSTPPSGLGTLSFTMARTPTWTLGTASSRVQYYNSLTGELDGFNWQMSESGGVWSGHVTWYHNNTGNLFGAGVARTLSPTTTRTSAYYYVANPL